MNILSIFKSIGKAVLRVLRFAESRGLDDDLLDLALGFVTRAQVKFSTNSERREWAVTQLVNKHLPESIARLAVEVAVQAYKKQVAGV